MSITGNIDEQYLVSAEVQRRYRKTRMTLSRWVKDPRVGFPAPVKFTPRGLNHWRLSDLVAWERERAAQGGK